MQDELLVSHIWDYFGRFLGRDVIPSATTTTIKLIAPQNQLVPFGSIKAYFARYQGELIAMPGLPFDIVPRGLTHFQDSRVHLITRRIASFSIYFDLAV